MQEKLEVKDGSLLLSGGRVGVLLVHGLGGTPAELRFVAQALNRAGYTVYCPLLVGHGGSEELLNTTTWTDWYKSVEEAHDLAADMPQCLVARARHPSRKVWCVHVHHRPAGLVCDVAPIGRRGVDDHDLGVFVEPLCE